MQNLPGGVFIKQQATQHSALNTSQRDSIGVQKREAGMIRQNCWYSGMTEHLSSVSGVGQIGMVRLAHLLQQSVATSGLLSH